MSGNITTKDFLVQSYEVDFNYNVLPEVILNYLQDTAMTQSESIGIGLDYLKTRNLFWVLTRYHVKILKYPKYDETVKVSTYAIGFNKVFAYRNFEVKDEKGETLVIAKSQWLLIDGETHKMVKIGDEFFKAYGVERKNRVSINFDKLEVPENVTMSKKFRATRSDIDLNNHVNNTRYLAWALDTTPEEVLKKYKLSEFDIVYKKEVFLNENIMVNTEIVKKDDKLKALHEIKNHHDEIVCCINTKWV